MRMTTCLLDISECLLNRKLTENWSLTTEKILSIAPKEKTGDLLNNLEDFSAGIFKFNIQIKVHYGSWNFWNVLTFKRVYTRHGKSGNLSIFVVKSEQGQGIFFAFWNVVARMWYEVVEFYIWLLCLQYCRQTRRHRFASATCGDPPPPGTYKIWRKMVRPSYAESTKAFVDEQPVS